MSERLEITIVVRHEDEFDENAWEQAKAAIVEAQKRLLTIPGAERLGSGISISRGLVRRDYRRHRTRPRVCSRCGANPHLETCPFYEGGESSKVQ